MCVLIRNAEAGDALAQYELATILAADSMTEQYTDSFYWYMKAALRGHAKSIWHAGLQLLEGEVVTRDIEAGLHLIQLAAKKRCYDALRFLGDAYHLGLHSLPVDKQMGDFWYRLADNYRAIDTSEE